MDEKLIERVEAWLNDQPRTLLTSDLRALIAEVRRLRDHVGWLTGDDKQAIALGIVPDAEMARRQRDAFSDVGYMGQSVLDGRKNKPG